MRRWPANGPAKRWCYPSRWIEGGPATSRVMARMDLNGFYLIQDNRQSRDGKEIFATHGVFTYDREDRLYKLLWQDSLGYFAPAPASGGWKDNTLTLVRGSLRGIARHIYEFIDVDSYSLKIQFSPDAEVGRCAHRRRPAAVRRRRSAKAVAIELLVVPRTSAFRGAPEFAANA